MSKIDKKDNDKVKDLGKFREDSAREYITTNQGLRINDDQNSLKAGERGPSLLEDFLLREKITHFDHERIPERIVHARGTAAHGYFQVYKSMARFNESEVSPGSLSQNAGIRTLLDGGRIAWFDRIWREMCAVSR